MQNIQFPEMIDGYYDDALIQQHQNANFKKIYDAAWNSAFEEIKKAYNSDSITRNDDIDHAIANAVLSAERVGFTIGFRYAVKLMQEVYA